jgi:hypothetical protein
VIIDVGPNLMWLAKAVIGLYLGWLAARPIVAAIEGWGRIAVARIEAKTKVDLARIEAGCRDPD